MTEDQFGRPTPVGADRGRGAGEPAPTWGEEQVLRALLHRAVDGVQPDAEALPRIRRAIPARRARHRQAWTGAVLIALVSAAAVPTLRGLGGLQLSDGSAAGPAASAGGSASGSPSASAHPGGARSVVPLPAPDTGAAAPSGSPGGAPSASAAGSPSVSARNSDATTGASLNGVTATASVLPTCVRADLGGGQATVNAPDGSGVVYGAFTVTDVSGHPCMLGDPGTITAVIGGADGANATVRVLAHTAGDPASGLPDPGSASGQLLLGAGGGYRLRFAFLPDAACPTSGGSASGSGGSSPVTSPTASAAGPAASGGASPPAAPVQAGRPVPGAPVAVGAAAADGGGSGSGSGTGTGAQAGGGAAPVAATTSPSPTATAGPTGSAGPATVTVTHRPLGNAPDAAAAAIPGVCGGGTLYRAAPEATG